MAYSSYGKRSVSRSRPRSKARPKRANKTTTLVNMCKKLLSHLAPKKRSSPRRTATRRRY